MSISWQKLRPWNGSQRSAFEELCCQLAAYEQAPQGSTFIRKGAPDAGIECYWILPNSDEWGWQAKFFSDPYHPPSDTQWREIDDSVETALNKHPRLVSLIVCYPIDQADPRIPNRQSFADKWNKHVEKWEQWAKQRGMSVRFEYWGEHQIWERLGLEKHRGRRFFWFNEEFFSQQWFEKRMKVALANSEPLYPTPNVELPFVRLFDGLGRTPEFYHRIKALYGNIRSLFVKLSSSRKTCPGNELESLHEQLCSLLSELEQVETPEMELIDFDSIIHLTSSTEEHVRMCLDVVEKAVDKEKQQSKEQEKTNPPGETLRYQLHLLYNLLRELSTLDDFIQSHEARLANTPALLLAGEAGTGKTHLFRQMAQQRVHSGLPTVLLLGEQFRHEEPWSQINRLLQVSCGSGEEFLGAIEAIAQARGVRALILIDALNEGEGKGLWRHHLVGMLEMLSEYSWIGIAISVRSSYESTVIPAGLAQRVIRAEHTGFIAHEYEAMRAFFDYFGIKPTIPLLFPEFQRPLFLTLFCHGLKNKGLTEIPTGLRGITAIFDFFLESIHEKLCRPEHLDFDSHSQIIHDAVKKLAQIMAEKDSRFLPRQEAKTALDGFFPYRGYEKSLFRYLLSEGVIAEINWLDDEKSPHSFIKFLYERFHDHLVTQYLLDQYLDPANPSEAFLVDQPLGSMFQNESTCSLKSGIIEALSVQLPERIQKELPELVPHCAGFRAVRKAFVESLIWRNPKKISNVTKQYINDHVLRYNDTHTQFYNALLTITSHPEHPYNADSLHKNLMQYELAERDAWWSIFLCQQYGTHGAVDRLVDWACSEEDKSHIDDESIRLCGMALSWFLTTSHRYLRDKSTKALVALLTSRIHILRQILAKFITVNDPYVLERLFAVAYGCALRCSDNKALADLAEDVYKLIFKNGTPPPHILLRDYARGVIEWALQCGLDLAIDTIKIRPPYISEWPTETLSAEDAVEFGSTKELSDDEFRAQGYLLYSIKEHGDFARYIIGTNHGHFQWTCQRLDKQTQLSRKEMFNNFVESLTERQRKAWEQYKTVRENVKLYRRLSQVERIEAFGQEFTEEELQSAINEEKKAFQKSLGKKKLKMFEEQILPDLTYPYHRGFGGEDDNYFDLRIAQDWIYNKVFDLGWRAELFGGFDRWIQESSHRRSEPPERIGKKYQWIAYHEFLARIADNFELHNDIVTKQPVKYNGPWQTSVRDIDPSFGLYQTQRKFLTPYPQSWWFPTSYDNWENEPDDITWLKSFDDLPALDSLITVTQPENNSQWFVLEADYSWEQPSPSEEERYSILRRDIQYTLTSYIVRKSDADEFFTWAEAQDVFHTEMPETPNILDVFFGELFGMPAFSDLDLYPHDGWISETISGEKLPTKVVLPVNQYIPELGGRDHSVSHEDNINISIPSKWLAHQMGLKWNGVEGHFFDREGKLIAFDPSVRTPGMGAFLIHQETFLKFLNENGYDIVWMMRGEKRILSINRANWKGRQELSGVYRVIDGKIQGTMKTKFIS